MLGLETMILRYVRQAQYRTEQSRMCDKLRIILNEIECMRAYELILITKASLTDALRKKLITGVKSLLKPASPQRGDLKITKENEIGQKALAYKIKKETNGFYFDFTLEGENVPADFEKKLLENENILRHLLLRTK